MVGWKSALFITICKDPWNKKRFNFLGCIEGKEGMKELEYFIILRGNCFSIIKSILIELREKIKELLFLFLICMHWKIKYPNIRIYWLIKNILFLLNFIINQYGSYNKWNIVKLIIRKTLAFSLMAKKVCLFFKHLYL